MIEIPPGRSPRVSSQLELELYPGEPWGGRSPRGLTRAALGLIFKPQGVKSVSDFVDPAQLELFELDKGSSLFEGGAPSLLPFPWEV